jgi:hypothetical protein
MIRVTVNISYFAIPQMDANTATASTHVAGRLFDFLYGVLCHSLLDPKSLLEFVLLEFAYILAAKLPSNKGVIFISR